MSRATAPLVFLSEGREAAILGLASLVKTVARFAARRYPIALEDAESAAWRGAIAAVDRYDPARGSMSTFARHLIRGAIGDYLRSLDYLSRGQRRKVRTNAATEVSLVPFAVAADSEYFGAEVFLADSRCARDQTALEARLVLDVLRRRSSIKARHWEVVRRHDLEGETLVNIGRSMHVGESRASQMRNRGLAALRSAA